MRARHAGHFLGGFDAVQRPMIGRWRVAQTPEEDMVPGSHTSRQKPSGRMRHPPVHNNEACFGQSARAYPWASASSRIQMFRKRTGWLWSCNFKGNLVGTGRYG